MNDRELMQQVLEALEGWNHVLEPKPDAELISALRSRLAQPVQEPAQRTWVGLTDEERNVINRHNVYVSDLIGATEAKLKEKNT